MSRHIVCLSFDFDTWSGLAARGLTTPTPFSRGEFGVVGAGRILRLLARHRIQSSWFIPGIVIETYPAICAEVVAGGHEVGNHGWTHAVPATMSDQDEAEGFELSNAAIRRLTGRNPAGYRSPSWDISDRTVDLLRKHGFEYESSLMGNDYTPYFVRSGDVVPQLGLPVFGRHTGLVEMPISWTLDDFPHFEFLRTQSQLMPGLMNANHVLENWIADFDYLRENYDWGIITYTFHPYVIGRGHRMKVLEKLIAHLKEGGAEFLCMADAASEFRQKVGRGEITPYP
ncbi:polysaccharide deacetylase [Orrella sp. JC864]|uniref:polysaccharide deacetylase family protein n=1 Tax=Orrella sp. JC864 TaxID=3120298 RepID=UPI00300B53ED